MKAVILMIPDWALRYKKPGCTIKEYGDKYYLYYATSKYVPERKYPVSVQTYIGRFLPDGVVSERFSIDGMGFKSKMHFRYP